MVIAESLDKTLTEVETWLAVSDVENGLSMNMGKYKDSGVWHKSGPAGEV